MTTLSATPDLANHPLVSFAESEFDTWLRHRRACGGDRWDEVWGGVYIVMPLANNEHQDVGRRLCNAIERAVEPCPGASFFHGCNVSDNREDRTRNYRCPDVAIFMPGNPAEDRQTHWLGGPDFAVEILSRHDRAREKLEFYAKVGVRELLFVDRHPRWSLEMLALRDGRWDVVGSVMPGTLEPLVSTVLPIAFRLRDHAPRPRIEVLRIGTDQGFLA